MTSVSGSERFSGCGLGRSGFGCLGRGGAGGGDAGGGVAARGGRGGVEDLGGAARRRRRRTRGWFRFGGGVPARPVRRGAGDLRDQIGDRDAVGVAASGGVRVVFARLSRGSPLPRRGGSRWERRSGKPLIGAVLIGAVFVGRASAARSGVIAVTHVPTGLRPCEQRARRCASAAALPPPVRSSGKIPWPRVRSQ